MLFGRSCCLHQLLVNRLSLKNFICDCSTRIPFPPLSDGAALTALFDATGGESWQNSDGWLYTEDLGQWHGVTTDAAGRVTELNLRDNRLSGPIPPELGNLTNLTELNLQGQNHQLSGCIPGSLRGVEYTGDPPFCN